MRPVKTKTGFIWRDGAFDDWNDEVDVKLEHVHRTMMEMGGMGIL